MDDIAPEAYCDVLLIGDTAPSSVMPMSAVEMHLFSYLASVLALFQGKPIGDWGYTYAVTSEGFPFSAEFEEARNFAINAGLLEYDKDELIRSNEFAVKKELDLIMGAGPWSKRRHWIKTATECGLAFPLGAIRYAINQSPGMKGSISLRQRQRLLDPHHVSLLYDEYKVVKTVLGQDIDDLLSPAVLWLSARVMRNKDA